MAGKNYIPVSEIGGLLLAELKLRNCLDGTATFALQTVTELGKSYGYAAVCHMADRLVTGAHPEYNPVAWKPKQARWLLLQPFPKHQWLYEFVEDLAKLTDLDLSTVEPRAPELPLPLDELDEYWQYQLD